MLKKLLYFTTILLVATLFLNISYATDIVMDLNTTTNSTPKTTMVFPLSMNNFNTFFLCTFDTAR